MDNEEKTFCINCFMDINIKEYIKTNGNYIGNKTSTGFKCSFCENSDFSHQERYDILPIRHKKGIFLVKIFI